MITAVKLPASRQAWTPPETKPLDETVWQAWVAKGREQDRRNAVARIKALKWVSIAGLLAAAVFGSQWW
jgi:uncharacterized protein (DUF1684 family)